MAKKIEKKSEKYKVKTKEKAPQKATVVVKSRTSSPAAKPAKPAVVTTAFNSSTPGMFSPASAAPSGSTPPTMAVKSPAAPITPVTHDAIAKRAYEIWIAQGRPDGRAELNWRAAERELRGGR